MKNFGQSVPEQKKQKTVEEMEKEIKERVSNIPYDVEGEREEIVRKFNEENTDSEYEFFIVRHALDGYPEINHRKKTSKKIEQKDELNWATLDEIKANKKAELQGKPLPYSNKKVNPMFDNDPEEKIISEEVKNGLDEERLDEKR